MPPLAFQIYIMHRIIHITPPSSTLPRVSVPTPTSLLCTEGSGELCVPISFLPPESGGGILCIAYGEGVVLIIDVV